MSWITVSQWSRRNTREVAEAVLTQFFGEPVEIKSEYVRNDCDHGGKMWTHGYKVVTVDTLTKDPEAVYLTAWAEGKEGAMPAFGGDAYISGRDGMLAEATVIRFCNNLKSIQIAHDADGAPYIAIDTSE